MIRSMSSVSPEIVAFISQLCLARGRPLHVGVTQHLTDLWEDKNSGERSVETVFTYGMKDCGVA
jgi:hypothetical protein